MTNEGIYSSTMTFGVRIENSADVNLSAASVNYSTGLAVSDNSFPIDSYQSGMKGVAPTVDVQGHSIAAWLSGAGSSVTTIGQGLTFAMTALQMAVSTRAAGSNATLGSIRVTHGGTGSALDISEVSLRVHMISDTDYSNNDSVNFQFDKEIATAHFSSSPANVATLIADLDKPLDYRTLGGFVTIDGPDGPQKVPVWKTFYILYQLAGSATPGLTHSVTVTNDDIIFLNNDGTLGADFQQASSSEVLVYANPDFVYLDQWNLPGTDDGGNSIPPIPVSITQADANRPVAKLTFRACPTAACSPDQLGSAKW